MKRLASAMLALVILASFVMTVNAKRADFEYKLTLTDDSGSTVTNPRKLTAGSTLYVEIEMSMKDTAEPSFPAYGLEFRLESRGLTYNRDGGTFRSATGVNQATFMTGDVVGFAYYDLAREGEEINNPMQVCHWSYTVDDPSSVNITVPTALLYIRDDSDPYVPIGNAWLFLDPYGGQLIGEDLSGEYSSDTVVILPEVEFGDYVFLGWTDGARTYAAGTEYTVSGIVTLTALWADLVRDRQVLFNPSGGSFADPDCSGLYAVGEIIILPNLEREGFKLLGWRDGDTVYQPGDQYTVRISTQLIAEWEPLAPETTEPTSETVPNEKPIENPDDGSGCWLWWLLGLVAAGLLCWWLILLWKRRWVLYSLKTGDVALSYKNKDHDFAVEVVLRTEDEDGKRVKYSLNKSGTVEKGKTLRYVHGQPELYPIVEVKPGKYKGVLIITAPEGEPAEESCRIKVLDRELKERKND